MIAHPTPGPWKAAEDNAGGGRNVVDLRGRRVAHTAEFNNARGNVVPDADRIDSATACANAELISAAPDLRDLVEDAPVLSKYHNEHGFAVDTFIKDYTAWRLKCADVLSRAGVWV